MKARGSLRSFGWGPQSCEGLGIRQQAGGLGLCTWGAGLQEGPKAQLSAPEDSEGPLDLWGPLDVQGAGQVLALALKVLGTQE